ncbi:MAG: hypothetical protein AB1767_08755 [Bacillota bacterium]
MNKDTRDFNLSFKDLFKGIGGFIDLLAEMADQEKDEHLSRGKVGSDKGLRGQYDLSIRLGAFDKKIDRLKPFKRINPTDIPEALCNIFDEGDHYVVIAELVEVPPAELKIAVNGETELVIRAGSQEKIEKTISLPGEVDPDSLQWNYNNSILEVRLWKR